MKQLLKAYVSFTRTERVGIVVLLSVIVLLIALKVTMHLWVHPAHNKEQEARLVKSWEAFKVQSEQKPVYIYKAKKEDITPSVTENKLEIPQHQPVEKPIKAQLFNFDPNTVDSLSLRKLGLREKTTSIFMHWRAKGKKFYHKEEFKKVYTLTPEEYERLEPYIIIK